MPFVVFFTVPKTKIGAIGTSKFAAVRLVPPYFCGRAIVAAHSSKTMTERSVALWSFLHKRLKGDASHKFHDPEVENLNMPSPQYAPLGIALGNISRAIYGSVNPQGGLARA